MALWERINEFATKVGHKRSDAVKQLVEKGLETLNPFSAEI
jgi:predicted DNA-binding protein